MNSCRSWIFRKNDHAYDLRLESRPVVAPDQLAPHEVLIAVRAASLNYRDLIAWKNLAGRPVDGRVPTSDGAGEVLAVGSSVTQWKPGDRVAGCFFPRWQSGRFDLSHHQFDLGGNLDGMLRERAVLAEDALVRIPSHLSYTQSATLPCAALTAWYALVVRGGLRRGDSVLVLGTGGVSIFALQIAHAMGAVVYATSSEDTKLAQAKSLGAIDGVNYRQHPQWSEAIWGMTGGRGVDHVVEVGGPGTLEQSMRCVAAGGHIALIGVLTGFGAPTASLFPLLARNVQLNGIYVGPRDEFVRLNAFLEHHRIEPAIDRVFSFDDAPAAFEHLHSGRHFGKVVIEMAH
jgi:NADPH:quinone reductase-like Zn-dependent oxidoreductase